jgi:hypothetical protein
MHRLLLREFPSSGIMQTNPITVGNGKEVYAKMVAL